MVCRRCGAEIPDWFVICGICGTPVRPLFGGRKRRRRRKVQDGEIPKMRPLGSGEPGEDPALSEESASSVADSRIQMPPSDENSPEVLPIDGSGDEWVDEPWYAPWFRFGYAGWSVRLGIVSLLALVYPYLAVVLSVMAILLGVVSLRRGEAGRRRAVAGIVTGAAAFSLGVTLCIAMAILGPYTAELQRLFLEYIEHTRRMR